MNPKYKEYKQGEESDHELIELINKTLGGDEKEYWLNILPILNNNIKNELRLLLDSINGKLKELNEKVLCNFGDE